MIGLVEHALGPELVAHERESLSGEIVRDEARGDGALEHSVEAAHREAAFARLFLLFAGPFDGRLDRDDAGLVDVHDRDAQGNADLRRRDPDAVRYDHRREHARDERFELGPAEPRLLRRRVQYRIADLPDLDRIGRNEASCGPLRATARVDAPRRALGDAQSRRRRLLRLFDVVAHPRSVTGSTSTVHSSLTVTRSSTRSGSPRRTICAR